MAETIICKVTGGKELEAALNKLAVKVQKQIGKDASVAMGDKMVAEMKRRAPVITDPTLQAPEGFLRDHINRSRAKIGHGKASVVAGPKPKTDYPDDDGGYHLAKKQPKKAKKPKFVGRISVLLIAFMYEYGTKHQPARPFIRPAIDAAKGQCVDVAVKTVRDELQEFGLK